MLPDPQPMLPAPESRLPTCRTSALALALMLASGADYPEAVRVANLAASIVVGKLGTAVVTRDELQQAV